MLDWSSFFYFVKMGIKKIAVQSSSFKIQNSISNTPEGADEERIRLTGAVDIAVIEALAARSSS
jgi:hypothetical protein